MELSHFRSVRMVLFPLFVVPECQQIGWDNTCVGSSQVPDFYESPWQACVYEGRYDKERQEFTIGTQT